MLVHLKIKKSMINGRALKKYQDQVGSQYYLAKPIHCKKQQSTSKVKKLLTQRVSMYGSNLQQQMSKTIDNQDTLQSSQTIHQRKRHLQIDQRIKKQKEISKNTNVQLSTLYKKSFKYNTTIHQILKNFSKNTWKLRRSLDKKNYKTEQGGYSLETQQLQLDQNSKLFQKHYEQKKNPKSERWQSLHKINDYQQYYRNMDAKNHTKCHINQIQFTGKSRIMIASSYQWKTPHTPFSKSNWISNSKLKKKLKQNISIDNKYNFFIQNSQNNGNHLNVIQQNPQNYSNSITEQIVMPEKMKDIPSWNNKTCVPVQFQLAKRKSLTLQTEDFRVSNNILQVKNKKKSQICTKNLQNLQFIVDGWNTKQKQQKQKQLFYHYTQIIQSKN